MAVHAVSTSSRKWSKEAYSSASILPAMVVLPETLGRLAAGSASDWRELSGWARMEGKGSLLEHVVSDHVGVLGMPLTLSEPPAYRS
jgi:hypothetical protein